METAVSEGYDGREELQPAKMHIMAHNSYDTRQEDSGGDARFQIPS
jgi:hypothetical protein